MMNQMSLDAFLASPLVQLNLVGFAGIVVWHLIPRRRANTRLVVQIAFFIVMTAILVGNDIAPHRFEGDAAEDASALLAVSAKLLWWVHLAWAIIGFVRTYLVFEGRPREARLLQDLLVGVVYLGTALSIFAFVFGVPIGTLVATSGVIAIILGLALQNALSNVFSGIALTLGLRLDPAQRRNGGTRRREHLAVDARPDRREQRGRAPEVQERGKVINLMDALRRSLDEAKPPPESKPRKVAGKKGRASGWRRREEAPSQLIRLRAACFFSGCV